MDERTLLKAVRSWSTATDEEKQRIRLQVLDFCQAAKGELQLADFDKAIAAASAETDDDKAIGTIKDIRNLPTVEDPRPFEGAKWKPDDPIPDRQWLIKDMLPAGRLASLYGEGAVGKSMLAMQIAAAIMHGGSPIAVDPELTFKVRNDIEADSPPRLPPIERKVIWLTWEDEIAEFRRRWRMAHNAGAIAEPNPDPERLTLVNMRQPGIGGPLWAPEGHISTRANWTNAGERFLHSLEDHALAVVDPLAAAFGSNENDRSLVRQFTAAVDGHAETTSCAVLFIAHPPKSKESGFFSGSTDWRNSVRASLHLEKKDAPGYFIGNEKDAPKAMAYRLVTDKANYSAAEGKVVWLRRYYKKGDSGELGKMAWFATTAGNAAKAIDPAAERKGGTSEGNNPHG